jgi:uncharacterized protein (TIGR03000 family)
MTTHRLALTVVVAAGLLAAAAAQDVPRADSSAEAIVFRVLVPADAQVTIDGNKTTSTGAERRYETPPLARGKDYTYTLKVTSGGRSVTRKAVVRHGAANTIDLRESFREATPPAPAHSPAPAPAEARGKPIRVLFVLGSGPAHDIRKLPPILEKVLDEVGGFKVTRLEPPRDKKPDDAAHMERLADAKRSDYDVLLFYTSGYKMNENQERAIKRFLDEGGGIVAIHGASLTFANSDFWFKLVGARFKGHIPGTHKLNIVITDTKHPITRGVHDFTIVDEEYKHKFADVPKHVLARFRERPPASDQSENMDILWTRDVGKGRLFYSALGHDAKAWGNPSWQKLMVQGICWAAGRPREVDIPARGASR